MRYLTALLGGAAGLFAITAVVPSAQAQSLFQKLFGLGGPPRAQSMTAPSVRHVIPPARFQSRRLDVSRETDDEAPSDSSGPYKTMCVRACDAFYFPIRHNARRRNFDSDIKSCRNACGDDAKLFYYPLSGPHSPDAMVDLAGRMYGDLPNAFAYRKAVVEGCTCKPAPWSYEEASRHQSYADREAIELEKDKAFLKARAEAEAKAKIDVAAIDANSGPEPVDAGGASIAEAPLPETPELNATPNEDDGIDMTAAIHAAFGEAGARSESADDDVPSAVRTETKPILRNIRRRSRPAMQRASYRIVSRPAYGVAYPKPSPGVFNLFGN